MRARTPSGDPISSVTVATGQRARRGDPGVYEPQPGEIVKVAAQPGAKFKFVRYQQDAGGDFAVVIGGLRGHNLERCVTVDRVQPFRRRGRSRVVRSTPTELDQE